MRISLSGNKILQDEESIGSFSLSIGFYSVKVKGRKMRIQHYSKDTFAVFTGHLFNLQKLAEVSGEILEYNGLRFALRLTDGDGYRLLSVVRESDSTPVAISRGNGTMEFITSPEPVLVAVCTFLLCVARIREENPPEIQEFLDGLHSSLTDRRKTFTIKLQLAVISQWAAALMIMYVSSYFGGVWGTIGIATALTHGKIR